MENEITENRKECQNDKKRHQNLMAMSIVLGGLFVGSLLVDFVQMISGNGFSRNAVKNHAILETNGKTWVAYTDPKITVQVITENACTTCDPSEALVWLRRVLPTLEAVPIESDSETGKHLIEQFGITSIPAFIFSDTITKTAFYAQASSLFTQEESKYFFDMNKIGLGAGKYLKSPTVSDADITFGSPDAPVTIIEYSDFQCPYCKVFQNDINRALKEYENRIFFVYKHLPLSLHAQAENAALAGSCADEQEKFRVYSDYLFAKQDEWSKTTGVQKFKDYAWRLGLNGRTFAQCLDLKKYQDKVMADQLEAGSFSISGTPGTFVNGTFLPGAVGYDALKSAIETELNK
ncbi:MAG: DsbA family protein [Minisyncoccota bacterium]